MPACRVLAKVVIEGNDAMDLGATEVERIGNDWQGLLRYIAEFFLNTMKDRQQRSLKPLHLLYDRRRTRRDLGTCRLQSHAAPSLALRVFSAECLRKQRKADRSEERRVGKESRSMYQH